jgi:hypothetical protein
MSAALLAIHGGAAMVMLVLLGALIPIHVQRAWRGRKNRWTGAVMVTVNALLVATAFGLYYAGSDALRGLISNTHIVVGVGFPVLLLIHILTGRRASRGGK